MLGNLIYYNNWSSYTWMLTATGNHARFIDNTKAHEQRSKLLTKSLIGFHTFTGCNFNPAFFNKGK